MLCFLYAITIGTALAWCASLIERLLPPAWPRRWLWFAVVVLSIAIPATYQAMHNAVVHNDFIMKLESRPSLVSSVWGYASLTVLFWALFSVWQVWRIVRHARSAEQQIDGVRVSVTEGAGPATVGFWRSRILVPRWVLALPPVQRRFVLQHEEEHRRAHDAQLFFVASLLLIPVPWHLALWWQLRRLALAIEIDCDNRVLSKLGDTDAYGELLLKVAETTSRTPDLQPALIGGAGSLERRLKHMFAPATLPRGLQFCFASLAIAVLFLVLWLPHPVLAGHQ